MIKNKQMLIESLENYFSEGIENSIRRVDCRLSSFIKQNGKINRLYINMSYVKKNGKYEKGSIGYFDLNLKEFIEEGYFYTAGVTRGLKEICKSFKIELDIEEIAAAIEEENKWQEKINRINELRRQMKEIKEEIKIEEDSEINKLAKSQNIDLSKNPVRRILLKRELIKSQKQTELEEKLSKLDKEYEELTKDIKIIE